MLSRGYAEATLRHRKEVPLFDRVASATSFTDLHQVVLLGEPFHMHLDGIAVGTGRIFDFPDGDLAAGFHQFQYLARERGQ